MNTRRLFVAVDPTPDARGWLTELSEDLRDACATAEVRARFSKPANLHLTLRFLGDTPEGEVEKIANALSPIASTDRFEIRFSGLGAFPNEKKSRVIWVGLDQGVQALKTLTEQVDTCLQGVGIAPEERPYVPHMTLARMKNRSEKGSRPMKLVSPREGCSSLVQEVVLYQSDLGPEGPTYTARARIPLG